MSAARGKGPAAADAEMDEEMRLHVDLLTQQNLEAGMSPAAARRAALLRFGPLEALQEEARAQRPLAWLADLARDAAYGARLLRREPGFAAVAVLTLGLGIGACVAIFSVVDGVLLRPLPYPEPERLAVLTQTNPPRFPELVVLPDQLREWRRQATSFEGLAAVRARSYNLTGPSDPARVSAARLTANTLSLLRVRPFLGRDFLPEEDLPGKGNVVLVGHGFWQRELSGRPDVLGTTLSLDGQPFTIIGVMPRGFELDGGLDLYTPAAYSADDPENRRSLGRHAIEVFGRLKPGVTLAEARAEMAVVADRLADQHPAATGGRWGVKVTSMLDARVGDARAVLLALLGAVGLLLALACANIANLVLARATARTASSLPRAGASWAC
jgi:predicted permease